MQLRQQGWSIRQIAARLGRAPPSISPELHRNATQAGGYRPFEAHRRATARRARARPRRIETSTELGQLVGELLARRWSRSRSAATCSNASPASPGCGCVMRASTRPSTSPESPLRRPSLLAPHNRYAPGVITGARTSTPSTEVTRTLPRAAQSRALGQSRSYSSTARRLAFS
jgi:transposase, IS30 family